MFSMRNFRYMKIEFWNLRQNSNLTKLWSDHYFIFVVKLYQMVIHSLTFCILSLNLSFSQNFPLISRLNTTLNLKSTSKSEHWTRNLSSKSHRWARKKLYRPRKKLVNAIFRRSRRSTTLWTHSEQVSMLFSMNFNHALSKRTFLLVSPASKTTFFERKLVRRKWQSLIEKSLISRKNVIIRLIRIVIR